MRTSIRNSEAYQTTVITLGQLCNPLMSVCDDQAPSVNFCSLEATVQETTNADFPDLCPVAWQQRKESDEIYTSVGGLNSLPLQLFFSKMLLSPQG